MSCHETNEEFLRYFTESVINGKIMSLLDLRVCRELREQGYDVLVTTRIKNDKSYMDIDGKSCYKHLESLEDMAKNILETDLANVGFYSGIDKEAELAAIVTQRIVNAYIKSRPYQLIIGNRI